MIKTLFLKFVHHAIRTVEFGKRNVLSVLFLSLWLMTVIFVSTKHELWRDEVRALSIALEPGSIWGLPSALQNEGHPILWYLILRIGYFITRTPIILQIASISIAFTAVLIYWRYSPFPIWQKVLFILSVLPLYEYSVMARNYGISMMLFFMFSLLYGQKKPFLMAIVLFALANTNALSCILVVVLFCIWIWKEVITVGYRSISPRLRVSYLCSFILIMIGIMSSVLVAFPNQESLITQTDIKIEPLLNAVSNIIKNPAAHFSRLFPGIPPYFHNILLYMLLFGLLSRPFIAISAYMGIILSETFIVSIYGGALRHQGIIFIFLLTLYWIIYKECTSRKIGEGFGLLLCTVTRSCGQLALLVILSSHLILSLQFIDRDISQSMSSGKAFGQLIKSESKYREAIIIAEPDFRIEALPYYVPNQIYIPREGRFNNRVLFTQDSQKRLSLAELLAAAKIIQLTYEKPVLIALGHFDLDESGNKSKVRRYGLGRKFTWSSEELSMFRKATTKIAELTSSVEDNYEIYLLNQVAPFPMTTKPSQP